MANIRTVITLRARRLAGEPPRVGELMSSASGKTVYRVLGVVRVSTAGEPTSARYRLTCRRLLRSEVPGGAAINPWRWDRRAPRQEVEQGVQSEVAAGGSAAEAPRAVRRRPVARARGKELATVADLGPGLRRNAVTDGRGKLLREADVEVDGRAVDPREPNRRLRRAYRVDPVDRLKRAGTIGMREVDAAGKLRGHLERVAPPLGAGMGSRIAVSGFLIEPITDQHIKACRELRAASAVLGDRLWSPVLWICLGGTVRGYSDQWGVGTHQAANLIAHAMTRLADHFYGRAA